MDIQQINSYQNLVDIIKTDYSKAISAKSLVYRGIGRSEASALAHSDGIIVNTNSTTRKSRNTGNWYTVILDSNPNMYKFPKRSKSLICTTVYNKATFYGDDIAILLPSDNSKIGCVGSGDIWDKFVTMFGQTERITRWNKVFKICQDLWFDAFHEKPEELELLQKLDDAFSKENLSRELKQIQDMIATDHKEELKNFLNTLYDAYSPEKLKMFTIKPNEVTQDLGEIWIDGHIIEVSLNTFKKLKRDPEIIKLRG